MELGQNTIIKVINEGISPVVASGKETEYTFEASVDGAPYELDLPFAEVKFINQKSCVFKEGYLSFAKSYSDEDKDQIYKELYIPKWRDILTYGEIEAIIKKPTKEGLNKLLSISTFIGFERIKGVFTRQALIKNNDISIRVKDLIIARAKEISERKLVSSLIVTDEAPKASEVDDLKEQIKALQDMVQKLSSSTQVEDARIVEEEDKESKINIKKNVKKSTKTA